MPLICDAALNTSLPKGLSIDQVYADYLQYLFKYTKQFFLQRQVGGKSLWERLLPSCTVVVAHPNGWGFTEQDVLRRAIIRARILPESRQDSGLQFVTEGEASVHFCVVYGKLAEKFKVRR